MDVALRQDVVVRSDARFGLVARYAIYFALLCGLYVTYLAPVWGYMGFVLNPQVVNIALATVVFMVFTMLAPTGQDARSIFLNLLLSVYLAPSLVLFAFAGMPVWAMATICLCVAIVFAVSAMRFRPIVLLSVDANLLVPILALIAAALILFFFIFGGFGYFNLDFTQVYDFRENAENALPLIFQYFASIFSKIIVPFGVVIALIKRKTFLVIWFFVASVVLFGLTSHKGILFYPVISVIIYYALQKSIRYGTILNIFIMALLLCFVDAALADADVSYQGWFATLFVRRGLMIPALLDYYHLDFFSVHHVIAWADSRLSLGLSTNPYGMPSAYVIGQMYFGDPNVGANTGFIGSGYAQAAFFGSLLYSVGAGLTLAIINAHSKYQGVPFVTAMMTNQILTMYVSTDFVTLFVSHGMIISFLLLGVIEPSTAKATDKPVQP